MIVYLANPWLRILSEPEVPTYDTWGELESGSWRRIARWVQGVMGEPVCWQRMPTIRHIAAGEPGYPLHSDVDFGHSRHTVNLWAPMTRTSRGAFQVEGHAVHGLGPGGCVMFPGDACHGSPEPMPTGRVSIDARFLPLRLYEASEERSRVLGVPLRMPEYFGHPSELEA